MFWAQTDASAAPPCFYVVTANEIENEFLVTAEMTSLTLVADILLNIIESDLIKFPLRDLNQTTCMLSLLEVPELNMAGNRIPDSVPSFDIHDFDLLLKDLEVDISCSNCSSVATEQIVSLISPVLSSIFKPGVDLRVGGNEQEAQTGQERIIVALQTWLNDNRSGVQKEIDRFLLNLRKQCTHHRDYDPDATTLQPAALGINGIERNSRESPGDDDPVGVLAAVVAVATVVFFTVLLLTATLRRIVARRQKRWLQSLPADQVAAIYERQKVDDTEEARLDSLCPTIFSSAEFPIVAKYLVPLLMLATCALFLSGFLSPAAEVVTKIYINDVKVVDFAVDYSMSTIVELTWRAGGRFLSVSIKIYVIFALLVEENSMLRLPTTE
jgi:hypothetical protein